MEQDHVLVTGASGMLGRAVVARLQALSVSYTKLGHDRLDIADLGAVDEILRAAAPSYTAVINCAGMRPDTGSAYTTVRVNALGPHVLAAACKRYGARLYQISTDCVFTGGSARPAMFTENEVPTPSSLYGRSKLAGEVGVVIRTSFVGPDHGLMRWVADQPRNATITGYNHSWWSGSTVREAAHGIVRIVLNDNGGTCLYHLATNKPVTKYEAVTTIAAYLGREDLVILQGGPYLDRSLMPTSGHAMRSLIEALELSRY